MRKTKQDQRTGKRSKIQRTEKRSKIQRMEKRSKQADGTALEHPNQPSLNQSDAPTHTERHHKATGSKRSASIRINRLHPNQN